MNQNQDLTLFELNPKTLLDDTLSMSEIKPKLSLHRNLPAEAPPRLLNSLKRHGQLQPIIMGEFAENDWQILDGKRRWACFQAMGTDKPVWIRVIDMRDGFIGADVATLVTNTVRSSNPLVELQAIQNLIHAANATGRELSLSELEKLTGMKVATLKKRLKVLKLTPDLMDALRNGLITYAQAERLVKLAPAKQERAADTIHLYGGLSESDLHELTHVQAQDAAADLPATLFRLPTIADDLREALGRLKELWQDNPTVNAVSIDGVLSELERLTNRL